MNISIRAARIDEHQALEDLQRRASLVYESDRENLLANPDAIELPRAQIAAGQVRVAEVNGRAGGFSAWLLRDDGDLELDGLFVEPGCWRCGIGRALVNDLIEIARASGARNIHVIANPNALKFYGALGFAYSGPAETRFGAAERWVLSLWPLRE
jgi:GNAT superfamily N-acetyltransferase